MADDDLRSRVGLSAEGRAILKDVESFGWFPSEMAIAHFAMAHAIRSGVGVGRVEGEVTTQWAIGNFDPDSDIRELLAVLYPDCATPLRAIEHFIDEGLKMLKPRLASPGVSLPDFIRE